LASGHLKHCEGAESLQVSQQLIKQRLSFGFLHRVVVRCSNIPPKPWNISPFKDKAQTALFKDPVRTAL